MARILLLFLILYSVSLLAQPPIDDSAAKPLTEDPAGTSQANSNSEMQEPLIPTINREETATNKKSTDEGEECSNCALQLDSNRIATSDLAQQRRMADGTEVIAVDTANLTGCITETIEEILPVTTDTPIRMVKYMVSYADTRQNRAT